MSTLHNPRQQFRTKWISWEIFNRNPPACRGAVTNTLRKLREGPGRWLLLTEVRLLFIRRLSCSSLEKRWLAPQNKDLKLSPNPLREAPGRRGPAAGSRWCPSPLRSWGRRRSRFWECPLRWATCLVWAEGKLTKLTRLASLLTTDSSVASWLVDVC